MSNLRRRDARSLWPWIAGGLAVAMIAALIALFAVLGVIANRLSAGLGAGGSPRQEAVGGRLHEVVADGGFQFSVAGMRCGARRLGSDDFGQRARGEFCLVAVTVRNIGTRPEILDGAAQTAYAADGSAFVSEVGAAMYVGGRRPGILERIDAGARVRGTLVFDVPRGTRLTSIVLRDSVRTRGVRIPLARA
ncbi:DUF4352 domain-containing protein [Couchioplanes azureus]|uniref:DUF4352 domain-containing protein n=1 Tax=Couchioplanes caeruleus TaxID=56438 RepID=UPI00166FFB71|nr:DUF4352 domain-containing protein [Couchioplanes caeruleus]GGQ40588.1 hypothetical protein GCM10010166_04650 [Couchioplanes caeruleus subsp. azureus]